MHDGLHEEDPPKVIPDKVYDPAPQLTAWQKLEAIKARLVGNWGHPSLVACGVCIPNLRQNIMEILAINEQGIGIPIDDFIEIPDEEHEFEDLKGVPMNQTELTKSVQTILVTGGCETLFHFLTLESADFDAMKGVGPATLKIIMAEQARLLAYVRTDEYRRKIGKL